MIDIVSITIALTSLAVAILTHIRHSRCCCIEIDMKDVKEPIIAKRSEIY